MYSAAKSDFRMDGREKERFLFYIGQVLYVWSDTEHESGNWKKAGIHSVCAVSNEGVWKIEITLRYMDGRCENKFLTRENGSIVMRSCKYGTICRWNPGNRSFLTPCDKQSFKSYSFEDETRKKVKTLEEKVTWLVSKVDPPRKKRKVTSKEICKEGAMFDRVLHHLRVKMELLSEKPLSDVESKVGRDVHCFNEAMKCAADCSLEDYMNIGLFLQDKSPLLSTFHPQNVTCETQVSQFAQTSVTFLRITDVCTILGDWDEKRLAKLVLKTKKKRGTRSPNLLRLIGNAYKVEYDSESPGRLFFTIGSCPSEQTRNLCFNRLPCLMRHSREQDENDMSFIYDIEKTNISSELAVKLRSMEQIHSGPTLNPVKQKNDGFKLRWSPLKRQERCSFIEDPMQLLKRPGVIELLLPTVTFLGHTQIKEILLHCSESYIADCLKNMAT